MEPTPFAQELISEIHTVTSAMRKMMERKVAFKAEQSSRTFNISMPDISEVTMLPVLLDYIAVTAPSIHINIFKITPPTQRLLETGELDLTIGFLPQLATGIYQQTLFEQNFVCIVAANHPRIGASMTRQAYLDEKHVVVKSSKTGHSIVEKTLTENHLPRKTLLWIPSYLSATSIVADTDCIATVPERFGIVMQRKEAIRILPPPVKFPDFAVKQHWHERYHSDAGNKWLRQVIAHLFIDSHESRSGIAR